MKGTFTVDEKCCLYVNIKHNPPWVDKDERHEQQPKAGLHPVEVMVSYWWDCKGVIHCEELPRYFALTVDLYCQQLDIMTAKIAGKGPIYGTIRLLHDKARPLTTRVSRQKLPDFGREVLTPPSYRPGLAPKVYQLLLTLSHAF
ncbi:hypothetical protein Y032_0354g3308 [Ancylostoma ceylanicum]|uniref:Uncharacterized protein n=1 Tax=Ancylostoma ceylanicum TaxID=53326 RepID=A0A016RWA5_9BILA|nr:hypothetical protein Y032_0354g3308 [Ancylostoma ceylanicum]